MELKEVMEKGEQQGMKTFDSALYDLFKSGRISYEEALKNADSKNNLRLRIQLSEGKMPTKQISMTKRILADYHSCSPTTSKTIFFSLSSRDYLC